MLQKNYVNEICSMCFRMHCINKHTEQAKPDPSCFVASGCATCSLTSMCVNPEKSQTVFELAARFTKDSPLPTCFVEPTCDTCFKASHCRNKGLMKFKLDMSNPSSPSCFDGYHSVK